MDPARLRLLLEQVGAGDLTVESALEALKALPFADLGFARVDHHRHLRQGIPEVVLAEGKTPEQIIGVARELVRSGQNVLITRLEPEPAARVLTGVPELEYVAAARIAKCRADPRPLTGPKVPVVTAGTSDIPVAEEALETLSMCGVSADRVFDVGVAGIHRIVGEIDRLGRAPAVIVAAGMEGALASVVGGLVAVPVVAVPTSVGYGVAFKGMTALFGMLASCASGVTVVNIDNGFGAAMAVVRIMRARDAALRSAGDE
jgi:NCAIR mutase (PurE)-related protein